jgi:hypothetical protein
MSEIKMAGSWIITRLQDKDVANFRQTKVLPFCIDSMGFECQALPEAAIASCMVCANLNPIQTGAAGSPEGSDFTSIQERIREKRGPSPVFPFPQIPIASPAAEAQKFTGIMGVHVFPRLIPAGPGMRTIGLIPLLCGRG